MIGEENSNVKQPVTKKIYDMGYTAVGLWRKSRKQGLDYSYSHFMAILSGRVRCDEIEKFLEAEGFGPELKYAQDTHRREQEAAKAKGVVGQ